MAYEVLVRTWRPLDVRDLQAAIRELCAANPKAQELTAALDKDARFTRDTAGRYGLDESRWRTPGQFSIISPAF
jgi:hypothetical protein